MIVDKVVNHYDVRRIFKLIRYEIDHIAFEKIVLQFLENGATVEKFCFAGDNRRSNIMFASSQGSKRRFRNISGKSVWSGVVL